MSLKETLGLREQAAFNREIIVTTPSSHTADFDPNLPFAYLDLCGPVHQEGAETRVSVNAERLSSFRQCYGDTAAGLELLAQFAVRCARSAFTEADIARARLLPVGFEDVSLHRVLKSTQLIGTGVWASGRFTVELRGLLSDNRECVPSGRAHVAVVPTGPAKGA